MEQTPIGQHLERIHFWSSAGPPARYEQRWVTVDGEDCWTVVTGLALPETGVLADEYQVLRFDASGRAGARSTATARLCPGSGIVVLVGTDGWRPPSNPPYASLER